MKIVAQILLILILTSNQCFSQLSKTEYEDAVEFFIDAIKTNNIEKLGSIIEFPLKKHYPIPPIKNANEFRTRYVEVFDDNLTSIIINSDVKKDWADVGWRGIMLNRGLLWLGYNGELRTVNYKTEIQKLLQNEWIEYERNLLHKELKDFIRPIITFSTKQFIVRIDQLEDDTFRYASWKANSKLSESPDLIIKNGTLRIEGSAAFHYYEFINGQFKYEVSEFGYRPNFTQYSLEVFYNDESILFQSTEDIVNALMVY